MSGLRRAAAAVYGTVIEGRGRAFDRHLLPVHRVAGAVVVSVGGLSVGGAGKTPMALYLAGLLRHRGLAAAIVTRGYRGTWERSGGVVSDGAGRVLASVEQAGDEALMLAFRSPETPVVVGADRVAAARRARALGARAIVLDSGFQHRRLARDLDLVCLDPDTLSGRGRLLPHGRLREPLAALGRADLVALAADGAGVHISAPMRGPDFSFRLVPAALVGPGLEPLGEASELRGRRVVLACGIARPERFLRVARGLGAEVAAARCFPDHHVYRWRDRADLARTARRAGADLVLTTEKDLVRLGAIDGVRVAAVRVEVGLDGGDRLVERLSRL